MMTALYLPSAGGAGGSSRATKRQKTNATAVSLSAGAGADALSGEKLVFPPAPSAADIVSSFSG
jgi:hypothetical protein